MAAETPGAPPNQPAESSPPRRPVDRWFEFRLYIANGSRTSTRAADTLKHACEHFASGHYSVEIIDVGADPETAVVDQVIATPTLVRVLPTPALKIVGDLRSADWTTIFDLDADALPPPELPVPPSPGADNVSPDVALQVQVALLHKRAESMRSDVEAMRADVEKLRAQLRRLRGGQSPDDAQPSARQ